MTLARCLPVGGARVQIGLVAIAALGCGATATRASKAAITSRDNLVRAFFAALSARDVAALMRLKGSEHESTLECTPPLSSDPDEQRRPFAMIVEQTKELRIELVDVIEDTVLADLPAGYDDGYGCRTKVALRFHRLVLGLRLTSADGSARPGKWTIQLSEHDGGWYLTSDVLRSELGTVTR